MFELKAPEVTTIIRWFLRVVLIVFLVWLVRHRPEQAEEGEEEEEQPDSAPNEAQQTASAKLRNASTRSVARLQPRREPYPGLRQRRNPATGEVLDFDAVIDKVSKPKEMWEVRKTGEPPQIFRRVQSNAAHQEPEGSASKAPSVAAMGARPAVREAKGKENTLHGHERPVTFITWNLDGNLLFTCGKDKLVCVWSCPEGECLGTYAGHSGAVWACSITNDARWLVTCGADRLVIVWEARTSRELARVELPGVVRFVEWAGAGGASGAAGERFVTCHNRFGPHQAALTVWRFDGTVIEQLLRIENLPTAASQVRWARGDKQIASAHEDGSLVFWHAESGEEVRRFQAHNAPISKFDFSSDGELLGTVSSDMSVRIFDLGAGSNWNLIYTADTDRPLNAVAFGPLTRSSAVGPASQRPGRCVVIAAGGQDVRDVAKSSSATEQFGTLLFRLGSSETLPCPLEADGVTKGHFGPVHTLAFARDGSAMASGSEDGCVRLHLFDSSASCQ